MEGSHHISDLGGSETHSKEALILHKAVSLIAIFDYFEYKVICGCLAANTMTIEYTAFGDSHDHRRPHSHRSSR